MEQVISNGKDSTKTPDKHPKKKVFRFQSRAPRGPITASAPRGSPRTSRKSAQCTCPAREGRDRIHRTARTTRDGCPDNRIGEQARDKSRGGWGGVIAKGGGSTGGTGGGKATRQHEVRFVGVKRRISEKPTTFSCVWDRTTSDPSLLFFAVRDIAAPACACALTSCR